MSKTDISGFKKLMRDFEKLDAGIDPFLEKFLLEMALRAVGKIKRRTPVGVYDKPVSFTTKDGKQVSFTPHTGKTGGTLRESWELGEIKRVGGNLEIEIFNAQEYASYVEYGHATRNRDGWVEGRFMATISMQEIEAQMPARLGKAWNQYCASTLKGQ